MSDGNDQCMTTFSDRERGEGGQLQLAVVDKAKATKKDKDTQQKEKKRKEREGGREAGRGRRVFFLLPAAFLLLRQFAESGAVT